MPDRFHQRKFNSSDEEPLNLDAVHDELGRVPVIGPESDRELFLDLPTGGLAMGGLATGGPATSHNAESQQPIQREFLANDFSHGQ